MAYPIKSSSRVPHQLWEKGTSRGIRIGDWDIETCKKPILNATETDDASARLDLPLPEITFGNNVVSLTHKSKGKQRAASQDGDDAEEANTTRRITFNGIDALAQVDTTGADTIKVAYAEKWAQSRNLDDPGGSGSGGIDGEGTIIEMVKNYDWTYSTSYTGTCQGELQFTTAPPDHPGIPLAKLARQDEPILFYDEVTLFEDELHDNGVANLTVRIRVMPSGFFLLSRFFLRVDNVLFRIYDVRLYRDFASGEILRETKGKEAPYDDVKNRLPPERADDLTPLTDHNWVANVLGMLEKEVAATPLSSSGALGVLSNTSASTARPLTSIGAPWANQTRRQVAPSVTVPLRYPLQTMQTTNSTPSVRAPIVTTPIQASPSFPAPSSTALQLKTTLPRHGAKRPWGGLGTTLQVATLFSS